MHFCNATGSVKIATPCQLYCIRTQTHILLSIDYKVSILYTSRFQNLDYIFKDLHRFKDSNILFSMISFEKNTWYYLKCLDMKYGLFGLIKWHKNRNFFCSSIVCCLHYLESAAAYWRTKWKFDFYNLF